MRATILRHRPGLSASTGGEVQEFLPGAERLFAECSTTRTATQSCWRLPQEASAGSLPQFPRGRDRPDLAREARRVSLISDAMGWDISAPNLEGQVCRLEVKCYRGRDPTVYLTRHEFNVGLRQSRWYLVLCRSAGDSMPEVVGWTTAAPLIPRMPMDVDRSTEWQVARVRIGESDLRPGLPLSVVSHEVV